MPSITNISLSELSKRDTCYGFNCRSSTWEWARWILFVLFIVGLIVLVLSAVRINKRRGIEGRSPITGTAWITPPSYYQSQGQQHRQQEPFVPAYTAEANDQDLGYYDNHGNFHATTKAQMAQHEDGTYRLNTLIPDQTGVSAPAPVQVTGQNPHDDFSRQFQRYYGTTDPGSTNNISNVNDSPAYESNPGSNGDEFTRPTGPPPAHLRP